MTAWQKIVYYSKRIALVFFLIGGLIFVAYSMKGKNKRKQEIQERLAELDKVETKTNADIKEAEDLRLEAKDIEGSIINITEIYKKKVEDLKKQPDDPKPGDAGKAYDDLKDAWK